MGFFILAPLLKLSERKQNSSFILRILWTLTLWAFSTHQAIPVGTYQLGVLWLNSVLTPSTCSARPHRLKAQSHKTAPISDANHKSGLSINCASDRLAINQRFPQAAPQIWYFVRMAHRTVEDRLPTRSLIYYKRKHLRISHIEEMDRAKCGGWCSELPCPFQVCHPPSISTSSAI